MYSVKKREGTYMLAQQTKASVQIDNKIKAALILFILFMKAA